MRKSFFLVVLLGWLIACNKESTPTETDLYSLLSSVLSSTDYSLLNRKTIQQYPLGNGKQKIVRALLNDKELVVLLSSSGRVQEGRILRFTFTSKEGLNGSIEVWNLNGSYLYTQSFINGYARGNHPIVQQQQSTSKTECSDCSLPEVIVAASYHNGEASSVTFYSLAWLFGGSWGYTTYLPVYSDGSGGGVGPIELDPIPSIPDKIDPQKYTDCFDQVSNDMATYAMTVYADLPADQQPGIVFDHKAYYAGHAFISLEKSNPFESVKQVFGFYPGSRWGAISGGNTASKIVDDSGHEFQASYTITVSQPQFNAAIQKLLYLNNHYYNISNFNCVDFILQVFQAGGGNFQLQTQYNIPVYGNSSGNNTPNGLYEQIAAMQAAGVPGTMANSNKNYGPIGKGPCY